MALDIMDAIRQAEISAQKRTEDAERKANDDITALKSKSQTEIDKAQQEVENFVASSIEKANAKAEEIIIKAEKSALLEAEKLRKKCRERQQDVNELIFSLII